MSKVFYYIQVFFHCIIGFNYWYISGPFSPCVILIVLLLCTRFIPFFPKMSFFVFRQSHKTRMIRTFFSLLFLSPITVIINSISPPKTLDYRARQKQNKIIKKNIHQNPLKKNPQLFYIYYHVHILQVFIIWTLLLYFSHCSKPSPKLNDITLIVERGKGRERENMTDRVSNPIIVGNLLLYGFFPLPLLLFFITVIISVLCPGQKKLVSVPENLAQVSPFLSCINSQRGWFGKEWQTRNPLFLDPFITCPI